MLCGPISIAPAWSVRATFIFVLQQLLQSIKRRVAMGARNRAIILIRHGDKNKGQCLRLVKIVGIFTANTPTALSLIAKRSDKISSFPQHLCSSIKVQASILNW